MKGSEEVCMMRSPTSVFGSGDSASISVFPVTELDRVKVILGQPLVLAQCDTQAIRFIFAATHWVGEDLDANDCSATDRGGSLIS